jgi:hypothetical protein
MSDGQVMALVGMAFLGIFTFLASFGADKPWNVVLRIICALFVFPPLVMLWIKGIFG